jgi:hypothetical protein
MANPWLILGGLYVWDRLNRNSREARENARRLAELEKAVHGEQHDEQPRSAVGGADEPGGCLAMLGCLVSLVFLGGLAVFLGWLIFG